MRLYLVLRNRRPVFPFLLLGYAWALLSTGASARPSPPQDGNASDEETYTLQGTVINTVTHAAIAHALVFSADNRFAKLTDDDGHFEFKIPRPPRPQAPPSGSRFSQRLQTTVVNFMARKPGFFQSEPLFWNDALADQLTDVHISLTPEALVVGRVNLPATDGSDKIQVAVYRREVRSGHAHWIPAGNVQSRANGEFRFSNLQEGDYKLFTEELLDNDPLTVNPRGQLYGYPPAYFPSASDFESAALIHLQAGQTFSADLTPSRREYYRIRIGVLNAPPGGGVGIEVEPQAHRGPGYSLGYNVTDNAIEGLLPNGTYTVAVTGYGEQAGSGSLNFSVNGAPVQNVAVSLAPNSPIQAHLRDERSKADNGLAPGAANLASNLQLRLVPDGAFGLANELWLRASQNADDDSLQFGEVSPGNYRVRSGCAPWAYVAAVNSGGRDVLQAPILVAPGASIPPLEIIVRDDGAELSGTIEGWPPQGQRSRGGFSANSPAVVLLPTPDSTGQFCQSFVSPDGNFNLPQVPPGEYRVVAFERMPENLEYENLQAMQKYESKGVVVRLSPGQKERLQLPLIAANQ